MRGIKCIKCGNRKFTYSSVANGKVCSKCQHRVVFDPFSGIPLSDTKIAKAIEKISINHTLFFTEKQFCYYLTRSLARYEKQGKPSFLAVVSFILGILFMLPGLLITFFVSTSGLLLVGVGLVFLLVTTLVNISEKYGPSPTVDELASLVRKWQEVNGEIHGLLPLRPKALPTPDGEVMQYSFDRVVVTDKASIAQFLIANNFHFENNCAVLSLDGYPKEIFEPVMEMLHQNPELKVFALHDCSVQGVLLSSQLRKDKKWFGEQQVPIYDLGLLPRQVMNQKGFMSMKSAEIAKLAELLPQEVRQSLLPEEIKWLEEGNYLELESLAPVELLKAVSSGIARSRSEEALVPVQEDVYYIVPFVYSSPTITYDAYPDTFG
ncbi:MAG: hypothetical protein RMM17_01515 [Acidobacteriota bacterium]|nr:hypothetical protein [Blastocatellia bacterium]MDW8411348.1 hypothetical protein [Acidobacteriota bacterium]